MRSFAALVVSLLVLTAHGGALDEEEKARNAIILMTILGWNQDQENECEAAQMPTIEFAAIDEPVEKKESDGAFSVQVFVDPPPSFGCDISAFLTYSGSATETEDYIGSQFLWFRFNADSSYESIRIEPKKDTKVEGTESIIVSIKKGLDYQIGNRSSVTINLLDTPTLTISANTDSFSEREGEREASISIRRIGDDLSTALDFSLSIEGTASYDEDFLMDEFRTLAAGESELRIDLLALEDTLNESEETITVRLIESDAFIVGGEDRVLLRLQDDPPHPCTGDYTHTGVACAVFWGCDSGTYFLVNDFICYNDAYEEITATLLDSYACDPGSAYKNCEYQYSTAISSRKELDDGQYQIFWNDDRSWMTITPRSPPAAE